MDLLTFMSIEAKGEYSGHLLYYRVRDGRFFVIKEDEKDSLDFPDFILAHKHLDKSW